MNAIDYSAYIDRVFGTDKIAAGGYLEGPITVNQFLGDTNKYFEFFGKHVASWKTWYRAVMVRFQE